MRWRNCWQMISISAAVGTCLAWKWRCTPSRWLSSKLPGKLPDIPKMPWNSLWGNQWTWKLQLFFSTLPDVEKVSEEPSFFTFGLQTAGTMIPYCHAFPWAWDTQPGWVVSHLLAPCWAVPPMGLEAWNAKWLWNLFSFLSCDRHRHRGWRGGWLWLACRWWSWVQSHHGCLVGYFSGASNAAGSLVLGTPRDFAEKSQALSKRGRRMDHRDLVAGAQVRVLHGAWSLARLIP